MIACSKTKNPTNDHDYAIKIQRCWNQARLTIYKKKIIDTFYKNLKGKKYEKLPSDNDCDEGHWLETQMDIPPNCKNEPDLLGYEQKKNSKVITFVDKQNDKYWVGNKFSNRDKEKKILYWTTFQRTNSEDVRIGGWKLDHWDCDGQCLQVDLYNNINVLYNYDKDLRPNKSSIVPDYYKNKQNHMIGQWSEKELKKTINNKFNVRGFYILKKNRKNIYDTICFGPKFSFSVFIKFFKEKKIYYDGYSKLNGRWRGTIRAKNAFWDTLITGEY